MKRLMFLMCILPALGGCAHVDFRQIAEDEKYCVVEAVRQEMIKILPVITLELAKERPDMDVLVKLITQIVTEDLRDQAKRIGVCAVKAIIDNVYFKRPEPTPAPPNPPPSQVGALLNKLQGQP